jgi:Domain of unknown function (DUF4476)
MQKPGLFGMNGFIVFLLSCFSVAAHAQQPGYLILIDAESKQAFTMRVGNQMYSSSGHGHLVLSQLKDSIYKLNLRFPNKNINDQVFIVVIHQKDRGFQLKGSDSSSVLYNWQTRETIHPVYEKDSSRMLEQGVKRDDGFSRLMAAVVNDTAVMYNTYAGSGFEHDSSIAQHSTPNTQSLTPKAQRPTPDTLISANGHWQTANSPSQSSDGQSDLPPVGTALLSNINHQPSSLNRDSLLEVKRQEIHLRDSLNTARKTAFRDSLIAVRKQQAFLKDSLNTARKAAVRDSLVIVKKQQVSLKDSLIAARKATKDNLIAAKKGADSKDSLMIAKKMQESNDILLAVNKENTLRDSLLAVNKANALRDSLTMLTAQRSSASVQRPAPNGQRQTKMPPGVKKLREVSLKISRKMVFLDIGKDGLADTITLFVYFETADTLDKKKAGGEPLVLKKSLPPDTTGVRKSQLMNKNSDTTGLSRTLAKNKNSDTTELSIALVKKSPTKTGEATACGQVATDADTQSLRSAILTANTEQEKIAVASGAFAMKCFSVSQVRLLASLLVSDKAKYRLMDAAHLHVADRDHFPELVDMLTDKNFQRKFLVMAEKRS